MKLSICIITKNEEKKLQKCLQRLKNTGAEIVIVDTGSTDNTYSIMKNYADICGEFVWCDDFARAKNYAASLATYDWVLTLDSDEYLEEFSNEEINRFLQGSTSVIGNIFRKNLMGENGEEKRSKLWIPRLYHRKVYGYRGRIHEQLCRLDGIEEDILPVHNLKITIEHDGYVGTKNELKQKAERNKKLLLLDLEEFGERPYTLYQLGKSCYLAGDYSGAVEYFQRGLEFDLNPELEYVVDMVETYGYALLNAGQVQIALGLESVYDTFGKTADFTFLMGLIYMNNGMFEEGIQEFLKAVQMPEGRVTGTNTYLPYYNIGVIYECLNYKKEAREYYKKCGQYEKAKERLRQL